MLFLLTRQRLTNGVKIKLQKVKGPNEKRRNFELKSKKKARCFGVTRT